MNINYSEKYTTLFIKYSIFYIISKNELIIFIFLFILILDIFSHTSLDLN